MTCEHDFEIDWHIFKDGTKHLRGICQKCGAKKHFPKTKDNIAQANKGSIAELEDLIEDIHSRFPLEDVIAATKKHIEFRLRNIHLKPEFRKELEKHLAVLARENENASR